MTEVACSRAPQRYRLIPGNWAWLGMQAWHLHGQIVRARDSERQQELVDPLEPKGPQETGRPPQLPVVGRL